MVETGSNVYKSNYVVIYKFHFRNVYIHIMEKSHITFGHVIFGLSAHARGGRGSFLHLNRQEENLYSPRLAVALRVIALISTSQTCAIFGHFSLYA